MRALDKVFEYGIVVFAFVIGVFHLLNVSGVVVLSTREIRVFHLVMMLVLLFMATPMTRGLKNATWDKFVRLALVVVTIGAGAYLLSRWKEIAFSGGATIPMDAVVGVIVILLVLEAARRGAGIALAILCTFFFTFPLFSEYLPGAVRYPRLQPAPLGGVHDNDVERHFRRSARGIIHLHHTVCDLWRPVERVGCRRFLLPPCKPPDARDAGGRGQDSCHFLDAARHDFGFRRGKRRGDRISDHPHDEEGRLQGASGRSH